MEAVLDRHADAVERSPGDVESAERPSLPAKEAMSDTFASTLTYPVKVLAVGRSPFASHCEGPAAGPETSVRKSPQNWPTSGRSLSPRRPPKKPLRPPHVWQLAGGPTRMVVAAEQSLPTLLPLLPATPQRCELWATSRAAECALNTYIFAASAWRDRFRTARCSIGGPTSSLGIGIGGSANHCTASMDVWRTRTPRLLSHPPWIGTSRVVMLMFEPTGTRPA